MRCNYKILIAHTIFFRGSKVRKHTKLRIQNHHQKLPFTQFEFWDTIFACINCTISNYLSALCQKRLVAYGKQHMCILSWELFKPTKNLLAKFLKPAMDFLYLRIEEVLVSLASAFQKCFKSTYYYTELFDNGSFLALLVVFLQHFIVRITYVDSEIGTLDKYNIKWCSSFIWKYLLEY